MPIVTIATTSGTGSEINECAVISKEDTKEKIGMADRRCKPVLAIVDPLYMRTIPPLYTAMQGFDAVVHHVEVMLSTRCNIMSKMIALDALQRLYEYLPIAVKDGNNLAAREQVAYASTMAGITTQLTRITALHSIEHALSAFHRNLTVEAFINHLLQQHVCDERFIWMAKVMGHPNSNDPYDFMLSLKYLLTQCHGDAIKMSDYGISRSEFKNLAIAARKLQGGGFEVTPGSMTDDDTVRVLENSYRE